MDEANTMILSAIAGAIVATTVVGISGNKIVEGMVAKASSEAYSRGYDAAQVKHIREGDWNSDGTNDLKLVQNDNEERIMVANPCPAEYGAIGDISRGFKGDYVPLDTARDWELGEVEKKAQDSINDKYNKFKSRTIDIGYENMEAQN
jgi:hypothetical protein